MSAAAQSGGCALEGAVRLETPRDCAAGARAWLTAAWLTAPL